MSDQQQSPQEKSDKRWQIPDLALNNIQIILIPLLLFGGMLVLDFRQRVVEGQEKLAEQEALEAEIAALKAEQRRLEAAKQYYNSDAFVEAWAHSEGKMVRPGEVIVIPLYSEPAVVEEETPNLLDDIPIEADTDPELAQPWRVWWSLFFDGTPPN